MSGKAATKATSRRTRPSMSSLARPRYGRTATAIGLWDLRPRRESDPRTWIRSPLLYPLSYGVETSILAERDRDVVQDAASYESPIPTPSRPCARCADEALYPMRTGEAAHRIPACPAGRRETPIVVPCVLRGRERGELREGSRPRTSAPGRPGQCPSGRGACAPHRLPP